MSSAEVCDVQRRAHFRFRCHLPVEVHAKGQRIRLSCVDLSAGGISCRVPRSVSVAKRVVVMLKLGAVLYAVRARVVRSTCLDGVARGAATELALAFEHRRGSDAERRITRYVLDAQRARLWARKSIRA